MRKTINPLSESMCDDARSHGKQLRKLHDGGGLYLWVYEDNRKFWRFRYWLGGKEKSLSLGAYPGISIEAARALSDLSVSTGVALLSEHRKTLRREAKKSGGPRNQFRLVLSDAGALIIETPLRVLKLTLPQTDALRTFLLAVNPE